MAPKMKPANLAFEHFLEAQARLQEFFKGDAEENRRHAGDPRYEPWDREEIDIVQTAIRELRAGCMVLEGLKNEEPRALAC